MKAFQKELNRIILRKGVNWSQGDLIRALTPKIRGYANYHRHTCATKTFSSIDNVIFHELKRWAKRRHPQKGVAWIKRRYWCKLDNRDWIFGTPKTYLPKLTWQHIVRHPRLRMGSNPFLDPGYFEDRKASLQKKYAHSFRRAHC